MQVIDTHKVTKGSYRKAWSSRRTLKKWWQRNWYVKGKNEFYKISWKTSLLNQSRIKHLMQANGHKEQWHARPPLLSIKYSQLILSIKELKVWTCDDKVRQRLDCGKRMLQTCFCKSQRPRPPQTGGTRLISGNKRAHLTKGDMYFFTEWMEQKSMLSPRVTQRKGLEC